MIKPHSATYQIGKRWFTFTSIGIGFLRIAGSVEGETVDILLNNNDGDRLTLQTALDLSLSNEDEDELLRQLRWICKMDE